jgi:hypothetical protein
MLYTAKGHKLTFYFWVTGYRWLLPECLVTCNLPRDDTAKFVALSGIMGQYKSYEVMR